MADEKPENAASGPSDAGKPEAPKPETAAEAALRAAQEAIASLNDDVASAAAPSTPSQAPVAAAPASVAVAAASAVADLDQRSPAMKSGTPVEAKAFNFAALEAALGPAQAKAIDLLSDVNLNVKIELGRTRMLVEDVLRLNEGAVVELDKLAGDPVDIYVNERHIARGEVLVLNDNFCVRIHEILKAGDSTEAKAG
jgi:flagellar motor switch protein FliN/FliY